MSMSMYEASIPTFLHTLKSLKTILEKAQAHAEAKKIDPNVLAASRLFPDMFPLTRQVQIASDAAKSGAARLAGVEPPKFEDTETTLAELVARIDKTIDYLRTFKPAQIDGSEERTISIRRLAVLSRSPGQVSSALGAAEFLLPRHHGLQRAAAQRCGNRQGGLPWGSALNQPGA